MVSLKAKACVCQKYVNTGNKIKSIFACFVIPVRVVSDNDPQYACQDFADLAQLYILHMLPLFFSTRNSTA